MDIDSGLFALCLFLILFFVFAVYTNKDVLTRDCYTIDYNKHYIHLKYVMHGICMTHIILKAGRSMWSKLYISIALVILTLTLTLT